MSVDMCDSEVHNINTKELNMQLLEIKEMHPILKREVVRHKFDGIDVVILPATPRVSPMSGALPKIKRKPEDLEKLVGETAEFELVLEDKDQKNVTVSWFKDKELLLSFGRYKIWQKEESYYLRIGDLIVDDESLYECKVQNEFGKIECDMQLLVDEEDESDEDYTDEETNEIIQPSFVKTLSSDYFRIQGKPLKLQVEVIGNPKPNVEWFFEDRKVTANKFIKITENDTIHTLFIKETVLDDEGVYQCTATNKVGQVCIESEVYIDEGKRDTIQSNNS